jgi:hypothetical protein
MSHKKSSKRVHFGVMNAMSPFFDAAISRTFCSVPNLVHRGV